MDPPEVAGVGRLRVGVADEGRRGAVGVGELGEGREDDAPVTEAAGAGVEDGLVDLSIGSPVDATPDFIMPIAAE